MSAQLSEVFLSLYGNVINNARKSSLFFYVAVIWSTIKECCSANLKIKAHHTQKRIIEILRPSPFKNCYKPWHTFQQGTEKSRGPFLLLVRLV